MAAESRVDEQLWTEFHRVVNMTSRELSEWLRTESADPDEEELPEHAGTPTGREVLSILGKRKADIDEKDRQVMRRVVDHVHALRREDLEPSAGDATWRRMLMSVGHDPLKPAP